MTRLSVFIMDSLSEETHALMSSASNLDEEAMDLAWKEYEDEREYQRQRLLQLLKEIA